MIICKMSSGFGNQLFQYFTAYALSKEYEMNFYLDISSFENDKQRSFLLKHFDLKLSLRKNRFFDNLFFKKIKDEQKGFQKISLNNEACYKLEGYWQSPLYFEKHKNFIYEKLFKPVDIKKKFRIENNFKIVSIHVRRGDYIKNPIINRKFKVCQLEYYNKAIGKIEDLAKNENFHFLLFSDDYKFISKNFNHIKNKTLVKGDVNKPLNDFNLMMNCEYNIISNSTFSWWAAWLNNSSKKIIISPKEWFNDHNSNIFLKDLLPNSWIKI